MGRPRRRHGVGGDGRAPTLLPAQYPRGKYLLLFDPLDGSSNIDVNVAVGSIFSILRAATPGRDATAEDFLQPGTQQVCAGYAIYGPSTMLVLTLGNGRARLHARSAARRVRPHAIRDLRIPRETREFAINASNSRFWEPAVQALCRRMPGRPDAARAARTSTCAGSPRWSPRPIAS